MKNTKVLDIFLLISGFIAAGIGANILFLPVVFYASNGIELAGNINLLNEIRASGGALLAAGVLIISGSFIPGIKFTAIVLSALLYLAYGLSRVFSFIIDGIPSEGLVLAAGLEVFIGLGCIWIYFKYRAFLKYSS